MFHKTWTISSSHIPFLIAGLLFGVFNTVNAQGLVWNLPESGTAVKYAGEYRQVTFRPESDRGDLSFTWQRTFEIRCLDRELADYQGQNTPCVWLEYEVSTGQQFNGALEAGPGGTRIYKILVPEQSIQGEAFFSTEVPNAFLPVVRGYQKIGSDEIEPFPDQVFQIYPILAQVQINEHLEVNPQQEQVSVTAGDFESRIIRCQTSIEDKISRSSNLTQVWVSETIPFGTVRWAVRIDREVKTQADTRDQFRKQAEINIEMQVVQILDDASSKLATP